MYVTLIKGESFYLLEICIRHDWLQLLTQASVHKIRGAFRGTFSAYSRIGLALLYYLTTYSLDRAFGEIKYTMTMAILQSYVEV